MGTFMATYKWVVFLISLYVYISHTSYMALQVTEVPYLLFSSFNAWTYYVLYSHVYL